MRKPKILFIDSLKFWHDQIEEEIGDNFEIIHAYNFEQARVLFGAHNDIEVVTVYDCVDDEQVRLFEFLQEIKRGFDGNIIACCSDCNNGDFMIRAGCDRHSLKCRIVALLLQLCG